MGSSICSGICLKNVSHEHCISLSVYFSSILASENNSIIKGWKYRSPELLKASLFLLQKKLNKKIKNKRQTGSARNFLQYPV